MTVGERILLMRKKRKMPQVLLADLSGIAVPTLCAYEKDERTPTLAKLENIAAALGCSPAYLAGWE